MPTIVTTKSVVLSTPVLDAKGKPVTDEVKFGGRKVIHEVYDHVQHLAGTVIDVTKEVAKELISLGHAREHVKGLDDDAVDPTKPVDPLG